MSHWLCYRKQQLLSERLKRHVTLEEVHMLCEELGFVNPEDTLEYIQTAPVWEIENVLARAKKKRRKRNEREKEYEYAYVT